MNFFYVLTADDLWQLTGHLAMRDADATWQWVKRYIYGPEQMGQLLSSVCALITALAPRGLTKGAELGEGDMWALSAPDTTSRASRISAQMLTASLNNDRDTVTALISAGLNLPEEEVGALAAHVLSHYALVLHAMKTPEAQAAAEAGDQS